MKKIIYVLSFTVFLFGCEKNFLEVKPNQGLLVPNKLVDLQALLDNTSILNSTPSLNRLMDDDVYVTKEALAAFRTAPERNLYIWKDNPYEGAIVYDWKNLYNQIFYANVVLDQLEKIEVAPNEEQDYKHVKGSALFFRAMGHYNLVQQFCKAYSNQTTQALGIPLKLNSDVNDKYQRSTLSQSYNQILEDLISAKDLLPINIYYKSRPSKGAAFALLARVNLSLGKYEVALNFASQSLNLNDKLINFNTLPYPSNAPFQETLPFGNDEVIFFTNPVSYAFISSSQFRVDTALYKSYDPNDLRKQAFFRTRGVNQNTFVGYQGIATPEMYLIRAEGNARLGKVEESLLDLNNLLKSRWKSSVPFVPIVATKENILAKVLEQRRKELVHKGLRLFDLKRLNLEVSTQTTITRQLGNDIYTLEPNSPKYIFPIPDEELLRSGITQN